ncbi:hypothetical protein EV379_0198 [Microterricola gilva]|uniref:Uncharacterized protein n=1 Tax=Microterricola gilva TaxID=393267 RepID=A0A4Q8AJF6_9MICO|nr:DUF4097 family beta strand repeat-containing protein [Microterricola gilva]RZU63909.1 hypothetical protein EV379_0198 [Microterricola gilva]
MAIEKWLIQPGQSKVIDLEFVRSLKVGMIGGKIDIIAHDETSARVEVHSVTGKELKVEIDGDRLEIDHPQLRWDNFLDVFKGFTGSAKAEVSVLVPRDVAIKLGVVSAEALVSGFACDAKLSTVTGDVVVDHVIGDLDVNTVNGEVSVGNHTGRVNVNTVSGDIVASGAITRFSADGVSGNMILDIVGTPSEINTNTVSGDLTVRLDAGLGERYRVNTVAGTVFLDDTTFKGTLGKGFERVIGELAGSWLDLQANSVSGNISIVRRGTPAPVDFTVSSDGEATA